MGEPTSKPLASENAGCLECVKLLNCKDVITLMWVTGAVAPLAELWDGANTDDFTVVALESSGEEPIQDAMTCYMTHDTDVSPRELRRMVEEAYLRKRPVIIDLDAYMTFRPHIGSRAETAIPVRNGIYAYLLSNHSTDDLTVVVLESSGEEPIQDALTCYMAHDTDVPPRELQRMVEKAKLRKKLLIIDSDAIAHRTVWGSQMQPAFETAAFGLNVGQLSGIVETDSGLHIIWRKS
ncbi:hypothetical protein KR018_001283 [Drosophila ironensis]|nr:hypothetical protein KR018_001283 [Drosophila ironensis]